MPPSLSPATTEAHEREEPAPPIEEDDGVDDDGETASMGEAGVRQEASPRGVDRNQEDKRQSCEILDEEPLDSRDGEAEAVTEAEDECIQTSVVEPRISPSVEMQESETAVADEMLSASPPWMVQQLEVKRPTPATPAAVLPSFSVAADALRRYRVPRFPETPAVGEESMCEVRRSPRLAAKKQAALLQQTPQSVKPTPSRGKGSRRHGPLTPATPCDPFSMTAAVEDLEEQLAKKLVIRSARKTMAVRPSAVPLMTDPSEGTLDQSVEVNTQASFVAEAALTDSAAFGEDQLTLDVSREGAAPLGDGATGEAGDSLGAGGELLHQEEECDSHQESCQDAASLESRDLGLQSPLQQPLAPTSPTPASHATGNAWRFRVPATPLTPAAPDHDESICVLPSSSRGAGARSGSRKQAASTPRPRVHLDASVQGSPSTPGDAFSVTAAVGDLEEQLARMLVIRSTRKQPPPPAARDSPARNRRTTRSSVSSGSPQLEEASICPAASTSGLLEESVACITIDESSLEGDDALVPEENGLSCGGEGESLCCD